MSTRVVIELNEMPENLKSTVTVYCHKAGHTYKQLKQATKFNQHICKWLGTEVKQPKLSGVNMAARLEVIFIECNGGVEINTSLDVAETGHTEKERLVAYRLQQVVFDWLEERNSKKALATDKHHVH